jgi:circadian clock protein KaiA
LISSPPQVVRPQLLICLFLNSDGLAQSLHQFLNHDRYVAVIPTTEAAFFELIEKEKQQLDCLVLEDTRHLPRLANWLHGQATLLPTVVLQTDPPSDSPPDQASILNFFCHSAEVYLPTSQIDHLVNAIDQAIAGFLGLSPTCRVATTEAKPDPAIDLTTQNFVLLQQRRLTDKLKERLGYLGVYYKRHSRNFFRNLPLEEQEAFLTQMQVDYRDIILNYFTEDSDLNQKIDAFVNTAFFADISVAQIVEIHMQLIDEFSKQLKLEGRSEEILLDYRLTLIDTIAHLCEMYRRSIPREP